MSPVSDQRPRPPGASDADVRAAGLMSEALERVERARGALYDLHQLIGSADSSLDDVVAALREGEHDGLADEIERDLIGLDVLDGRWTFQVIEEFDAGFFARWQSWEQRLRAELVGGSRHVHEAELKARRQGRDATD